MPGETADVVIAGEGSRWQVMPPLTRAEYDSLVEDIRERGVQVPIEVDEHGEILDGHYRLRAAEEAGVEEVPRIVRIGMSDDEKLEHVLTLNLARRHLTIEGRRELVACLRMEGWSLRRIAGRLGVSLNTVWHDTEAEGVEPEVPVEGLDGREYSREQAVRRPWTLTASREEEERALAALQRVGGAVEGDGGGHVALGTLERAARRVETPAEAEELPRVSAAGGEVAPGDIWTLGRHLLVCGDSRDGRVLDAAGIDGEVRLVWTDPPYGVEYEGAAGTLEGDTLEGQRGVLDVFRRVLDRVETGVSWYVCCAPGPDVLVYANALREAGVLRQILVWRKDRMVLGHSDYQYAHEFILYGWKPGARRYLVSDRTLTSVWEVSRPSRSEGHPTMKPVELARRAIVNSTPGSGRPAVVADPFAGAGGVMVACELEGREARMVEIDPRFCDVILDRARMLRLDVERVGRVTN